MAGSYEEGEIVKSTAGRDKGNYYIILKTGPYPFVYIADGITRRVERPKKKNIKHLHPLDLSADDIRRQIQARMRVSNQDVARA